MYIAILGVLGVLYRYTVHVNRAWPRLVIFNSEKHPIMGVLCLYEVEDYFMGPDMDDNHAIVPSVPLITIIKRDHSAVFPLIARLHSLI